MTDSPQHQTTKSGPKTDGRFHSEQQPHNISDLHALVKVGDRFGSWEVTSEAWREKGHRKVSARCDCGTEKTLFFDNLKSGKSTSCKPCALRAKRWNGGRTTPDWLRDRFSAAKNRCTSPGGTQWMIDNCGLPSRSMDLDRTNNDGHYEPGNLRWLTRAESLRNRRGWKQKDEPVASTTCSTLGLGVGSQSKTP